MTKVIAVFRYFRNAADNNNDDNRLLITQGAYETDYFLFRVTLVYAYDKSKAAVSRTWVRRCDVSVQCDHH
jgi:hypothetical protein